MCDHHSTCSVEQGEVESFGNTILSRGVGCSQFPLDATGLEETGRSSIEEFFSIVETDAFDMLDSLGAEPVAIGFDMV